MTFDSGVGEKFLSGTLTKTEVVDLIGEVFTTPDFYDSCWDEFEALFRRVVWVFTDRWMVTFGPNEGLFIQHLDEKWEEAGSPASEVAAVVAQFDGKHEFSSAANGFQVFGPDGEMPSSQQIVLVVDSLAKEHGEPILALPWGDILDRISDRFEDEDYDEDDEESLATLTFMDQVNKASETPSSPWQTQIASSDGYFPEHSGYARFYRLMDDLEERNWIVINGECCGTCAGSSIRFARAEDPSKENSPVFVVYEQNAEFSWGVSGWINSMHGKDVGFDELAEVVASSGLKIEFDNDSKDLFYIRS